MTILDGRTALVTGAASGIGKAIVQRMAADGAHVVAVDRDEAGLTALADEVAGVEAVVCDLSDLDAVDALPAAVDVLVNNAGHPARGAGARVRSRAVLASSCA